ncbi:MAG: Y-family DNA polymerase [Gemmatimonadaceae bacterium]
MADADAFYASVARLIYPEAAEAKLLIVGGTRESRGVVLSASYEARQFGVRSAMPISRALRLCPNATCVPVPFKQCGAKGKEIRAVLEKYAPSVEGASIDEWYMDMTGTEGVYRHEPLEKTAHRMRDAVKKATGISVSIGGGTNKLIAKLAVERAKPKPGTGANGVHIVAAGTEQEFLKTLVLADIPMVGPKFQQKLQGLGLITVPDLLQHDLPTLSRWLGERASHWLWDRVHGESESPVEGRRSQRSMSHDETFGHDLRDDHELEHELLSLASRIASDLRGDGLTARTITVKIRDFDFRTRSARRTLPEPVISDRAIWHVARELLLKLRVARRVPARLLGVALSSLAEDPKADQLVLFTRENTVETDRDRALARSVDRVRKKYGPKGILPASLAQQ